MHLQFFEFLAKAKLKLTSASSVDPKQSPPPLTPEQRQALVEQSSFHMSTSYHLKSQEVRLYISTGFYMQNRPFPTPLLACWTPDCLARQDQVVDRPGFAYVPGLSRRCTWWRMRARCSRTRFAARIGECDNAETRNSSRPQRSRP